MHKVSGEKEYCCWGFRLDKLHKSWLLQQTVLVLIEQHHLATYGNHGLVSVGQWSAVLFGLPRYNLYNFSISRLSTFSPVDIAANIFTEHFVVLPNNIWVVIADVADHNDLNEFLFFQIGLKNVWRVLKRVLHFKHYLWARLSWHNYAGEWFLLQSFIEQKTVWDCPGVKHAWVYQILTQWPSV